MNTRQNQTIGRNWNPPDFAKKHPLPEDAFKEWKRAHNDEAFPCPDEAQHCAFMSGIAYCEESLANQSELKP